MRVCTCSHAEIAHRGNKTCAKCNCSCFQDKDPPLITRVAKLEGQVAALIDGRSPETCSNQYCECEKGKCKEGKCIPNWNVCLNSYEFLRLGHYSINERYNKGKREVYLLESEVLEYLNTLRNQK